MDKLEKVYKEKLFDFESNVSDSLWTGIAASLDRKKRNKRILIYLSILTILAILVTSIYFGLLNNNKSESTPSKPTSTLVLNSESQGINDNSPNTIIEHENISSQYSNLISGTFRSKNNNLTQWLNKSDKAAISAYEELNDLAFVSSLVLNSLTEPAKIPGRSFTVISQSRKNNSILGNYENSLKNYSKGLIKRRGILDDCFPSKTNSWLLEAYIAPMFGDKSLTGTNSNFIKSRENSENPLISYSTGIRIGYNYKGTVFKTGVDYTSINEKFKIVLKNVVSTQTIITIDTIKHSDGTYTITRDTTIKELYGEKDIRKFNTYRMLGIPFIIGYELKYQKHTFGLNAGIIVNLLLKKSGFILDENGKTIDLEVYGDNIFVNRTGASLYSSLFYTYALNNRFAIFAEPRFTYDLFPITKKEYALKQRYFTYGISFGGRYLF